MVRAELAGIVDAIAGMLADTRLEDDLADLLWSFVAIFHRKIDRLGRDLDANEQAQRLSRLEQNGSEVRSVELERLIEQGIGLVERRNAWAFRCGGSPGRAARERRFPDVIGPKLQQLCAS